MISFEDANFVVKYYGFWSLEHDIAAYTEAKCYLVMLLALMKDLNNIHWLSYMNFIS